MREKMGKKELVATMANETKPEQTPIVKAENANVKSERSKRRLKVAPTIREQAEAASKKAAKSSAPKKDTVLRAFFRGFLLPFRKIGRFLKRISRFVVPPYFRNAWKELRQVTWLTLRESRRLTGAVIMFAITFGIIIAILDYGLDKLFKEVLLR